MEDTHLVDMDTGVRRMHSGGMRYPMVDASSGAIIWNDWRVRTALSSGTPCSAAAELEGNFSAIAAFVYGDCVMHTTNGGLELLRFNV